MPVFVLTNEHSVANFRWEKKWKKWKNDADMYQKLHFASILYAHKAHNREYFIGELKKIHTHTQSRERERVYVVLFFVSTSWVRQIYAS